MNLSKGIHFKVLRWKNFLSTGNMWTEVFLDKSSNTLIIGMNGAGKSTLLDALTFVLFGKSFRGINKPSLVNTINEKDCIVEVEFRIGNKEYKIERGISPNVFNIYLNGTLVNQDAKNTDYQVVLEKQILKFNYKAFTQIVILGSSSFVPFMQLPALDRRAIIEDLLDIEIFSSMNNIVKSQLKEYIAELDSTKIKLEATLSKIELQKKYVEEAKKNNTLVIEQTKQQYADDEAQVNKLMAEAELVNKHIVQLLKQVEDEESVKKRLKTMEGYYHRIDMKKAKQEKDYEFYAVNDSCQTCLQVIQEEFKANKIKNAERNQRIQRSTQLYGR